jgi:hypothetical protein
MRADKKDKRMSIETLPIEMIYIRYDYYKSSKIYLICFHQGKLRVNKLFVIGEMRVIDEAISPDKRFYFMSAVSNGTFCGVSWATHCLSNSMPERRMRAFPPIAAICWAPITLAVA